MDRPGLLITVFLVLLALIGVSSVLLLGETAPEAALPPETTTARPAVDFRSAVVEASLQRPVVVVFSRAGDRESEQMEAHVRNQAQAATERVFSVVLVDVEVQGRIATQAGIDGPHGLALFHAGRLLARCAGPRSLGFYTDWLNGALDQVYPPDPGPSGASDR
jgi:thioredoxin-like negative regulator of GroEL